MSKITPTTISTDESINKILLSSLPHPAMYIRRQDRMVIAANKIATDLGVKVGGYCWREFMREGFLSDDHKKISADYPNEVPPEFGVRCSFCLGDKCFSEATEQNNPEVHSFGLIWNTYWIKVSEDIYLHYAVNITERKTAEENLKSNQDRLSRTQEMAHLGSWELDILSGNLTWSDEVYRIFGLKPQEIAPTHDIFMEFVHPDDREALRTAYFGSIEKNKNGYEMEHRIVRKQTGEIRYVFEKCEHTRDSAGLITRSVGMVHDRTQRKLSEIELLRKERLLSITGTTAKIGGWELDADTLMTAWTEEVFKIHELDSSFNSNLEKGINFYSPESKPIIEKAVKRAIEAGEPFDLELGFITAKGNFKWVHSIGKVYQENGLTKKVYGSFQDITERKLAEQELQDSEAKYRDLVENSPDAIAIYSNGIITYVNSQCLQLMAASSKKDLIGKTVLSFVHPDFRNMVMERMKKTTGNGNIMPVAEEKFLRLDGSAVDVEVKAIPIRFEGKPAVQLIVRDIGQRKIHEIQLQQFTDDLSRLNADKDRFISLLAHDLKNPFNALLGLSELLLENVHKYSAEKIENIAELINKSAQNNYNLLDDLLLWARSQSGKISFEPQNFRLNDIFDEVILEMSQNAENKNISLQKFSTENIVVKADLSMVKTVVRNLVSNSIKFTNSGGEISLNAEMKDSFAIVTVSDNGIGIKPELVEDLFSIAEPHSTKGTENESGTGLGLILCKDFVIQNGGEIWLESEMGKGSSFKFTLPLGNK